MRPSSITWGRATVVETQWATRTPEIFGVFVSAQVERIAAALGHNVLHHHVAHAGRERAAGAFLVIEIDVDTPPATSPTVFVAEVEILPLL